MALLVLSLLLPPSLSTPVLAAPAAQTALQGEIAYVKDGDIWLLDLFTHESQQLTTDGNNRLPSWSTDGRYLLYTHGDMEETAALYILEVGQGEPRLLVENACCAAWEPNGDRIAYIALAGNALAIEAVRSDGSGKKTLFAPLQYGRSSWPTSNMLWTQGEGEDVLVTPIEFIESSTQGGLTTYRDVLHINLNRNTLSSLSGLSESRLAESALAECSALGFTPAIKAGEFLGFAWVFEGSNCGGATTSLKGIGLELDSDRVELPWLAYPSWSPDGQFLAAERYQEADNPADAALRGLVLYNLADNTQQPLLEAGSQPAWRPGPTVDPIVAHYARPGERIVTIEPALIYQGSTYQVSYMATGDYTRPSAQLFTVATPEFFADQGITALVVTKDGQVITDAETLRQVLLLYSAAYTLYESPPTTDLPFFGDELQKVLDNLLLMAAAVPQLFTTRRDQTSETLRQILSSPQAADAALQPLFDQVTTQNPHTIEEALQILSKLIEEQQKAQTNIWGTMAPDLQEAYADLDATVELSSLDLKVLRLVSDLLFLSQLQAQRAQWLNDYAAYFTDVPASLDRDQLRAATQVIGEVEDVSARRQAIAQTFTQEFLVDKLWDASGKVAAQVSSQLLEKAAEKAGVQLAAHTAAGALSAVSIGFTAGNILYGIDALYANFSVAQRSEELRTVFAAGRQQIEERAGQSQGEPSFYDSDLAAQFHVAYLLETLAAIQTQRAYADGVAATFALPNPLELINWLRGEDWQQAVAEIRQMADQTEMAILNQLAEPEWLETAITLALSRMPQGPTVIVGTPVEPDLPKLHPEWTSYTNGNYVNDLLVQEDTIWAATSGGVVRWDTRTERYVKFTSEYGLGSNRVTSIARSIDGAIWFGTSYSGVSRLDPNGHWTILTTKDGLANNNVMSIIQSNDGVLWFGTWGGVSRLDTNGHWDTFTKQDGLGSDWVNVIFQSADGALWFGTYGGGVSRLDVNGQWRTFTKDNGLVGTNVQSIIQSSDDALWFSTWEGISRLDPNGSWTTFTKDNGLISNEVNVAIQSTDGSFWFGTTNGVSRLDPNGQWTSFKEENGLASNIVLSIAQGADGALWFGSGGWWTSSGGISRLDAAEDWTTFTTDDGLANNVVLAMTQTTDGAVWFGTNNGVNRLNRDGQWTNFTVQDGLADNYVQAITQSVDGAIWFGTCKGGVSRMGSDGRWITFAAEDGLASNCVAVITQTIDGALWFGTGAPGWGGSGGGVSRLDSNGHWTTFSTEDGLATNDVLAIIQAMDGAFWFGTWEGTAGVRGGVSILNPVGRWTTLTTENGLANNNVYDVIINTDGSLWFATWGGGVSRFDDVGHWTTFTTDDGLVSNRVSSIVQTADGALWFSTSIPSCAGCAEGVSRMDPDGHWTTFTTVDGLAHNEVLSMAQDTDGALWFGTYGGGVSRLDAEAVRRLGADDGTNQPKEPNESSSNRTDSSWEYQRIDGSGVLGGDPTDVANLFNPLGQDGWDVAGVTGATVILKRPLTNPGAWQYQIVNGNPADVATLLNLSGKEGWEVAGITATYFILKRPLTNPGAWEYQSTSLTRDLTSTALLNPLGQAGWDLAGATGPFLILKRPPVTPVTWEYQIIDGGSALVTGDPAAVATLLNPLGQEGWEMASATATFFILKRPLTDPGQWEYQMVNGSSALGREPAAMATLLNPLGAEGWDIAGMTGPVLIMKRELHR